MSSMAMQHPAPSPHPSSPENLDSPSCLLLDDTLECSSSSNNNLTTLFPLLCFLLHGSMVLKFAHTTHTVAERIVFLQIPIKDQISFKQQKQILATALTNTHETTKQLLEKASIVYCPEEKRGRSNEEKKIPINAITHIEIGKQTAAFVHNKKANTVPEQRCLSIRAEERTLDMVFGSEEEREKWIQGLKKLYSMVHAKALHVRKTPSINAQHARQTSAISRSSMPNINTHFNESEKRKQEMKVPAMARSISLPVANKPHGEMEATKKTITADGGTDEKLPDHPNTRYKGIHESLQQFEKKDAAWEKLCTQIEALEAENKKREYLHKMELQAAAIQIHQLKNEGKKTTHHDQSPNLAADNDLQQVITDQQSKITSLQRLVDELNATIEELQAEKASLLKSLSESQSSRNDFSATRGADAHTSDMAMTKNSKEEKPIDDIAALQQQCMQQRYDLEALQRTNALLSISLEQRKVELQKSASNQESEIIAELRSDIERLNSELRTTRTQSIHFEDQCSTLTNQVLSLKAQLAATEDVESKSRSQNMVHQLQQDLEEMEQDLLSKDKLLKAVTTELKTLKQNLPSIAIPASSHTENKANNIHGTLKGDLMSQLQQDLEEMESELIAKSTAYKKLEAEFQSLLMKSQTQAQNDIAESSLPSQELSAAREQIADEQRIQADLRLQLEALNVKLKKLNKQQKEEKDKAMKLEKISRQAETKLAKATKQTSALQDRVAELEAQLTTTKDALLKKDGEISELREAMSDQESIMKAQQLLQTTQEELEQLKEEHKAVVATSNENRESVSSLTALRAVLLQKVSERDQIIEQLQLQLSLALAKFSEQSDAFKKETEALQIALQSRSAENTVLSSELEAVHAELKNYKVQFHDGIGLNDALTMEVQLRAELENKVGTLTNDLRTLNDYTANVEQQLNEQLHGNCMLTLQVDDLHVRLDAARKALVDLRHQVMHPEEKENCETDVATLQRNVQGMQAVLSNLTSSNTKLETANEELTWKLFQIEVQLEQTQTALDHQKQLNVDAYPYITLSIFVVIDPQLDTGIPCTSLSSSYPADNLQRVVRYPALSNSETSQLSTPAPLSHDMNYQHSHLPVHVTSKSKGRVLTMETQSSIGHGTSG